MPILEPCNLVLMATIDCFISRRLLAVIYLIFRITHTFGSCIVLTHYRKSASCIPIVLPLVGLLWHQVNTSSPTAWTRKQENRAFSLLTLRTKLPVLARRSESVYRRLHWCIYYQVLSIRWALFFSQSRIFFLKSSWFHILGLYSLIAANQPRVQHISIKVHPSIIR